MSPKPVGTCGDAKAGNWPQGKCQQQGVLVAAGQVGQPDATSHMHECHVDRKRPIDVSSLAVENHSLNALRNRLEHLIADKLCRIQQIRVQRLALERKNVRSKFLQPTLRIFRLNSRSSACVDFEGWNNQLQLHTLKRPVCFAHASYPVLH